MLLCFISDKVLWSKRLIFFVILILEFLYLHSPLCKPNVLYNESSLNLLIVLRQTPLTVEIEMFL